MFFEKNQNYPIVQAIIMHFKIIYQILWKVKGFFKIYFIFLTKKNNYSMKGVIYAMQLRHLCLYSSLKNIIRPEVKVKWNIDRYNETKNKLEKELKKTTLWLLKYKK